MVHLDRYAALLTDWQTRMNLVGPSTLPQTWHRHFADSAQLLVHAGHGRTWLDIGAGGGFPGLLIATIDPKSTVTLVESIAKKCRFLETVASELGLDRRVRIENRRVEALPRQRFDIITARALAPIVQIFDWARHLADKDTRWVLPKGARWEEELAATEGQYRFSHVTRPSLTDAQARIIIAHDVVAQ